MELPKRNKTRHGDGEGNEGREQRRKGRNKVNEACSVGITRRYACTGLETEDDERESEKERKRVLEGFLPTFESLFIRR